jgi:hypothetical protein
MNDQDHSLSLSDPDRSLVLSHLLVNFLINLASCQTGFKGGLTPRQQLTTCCLQHFLVMLPVITKKCCRQHVANYCLGVRPPLG